MCGTSEVQDRVIDKDQIKEEKKQSGKDKRRLTKEDREVEIIRKKIKQSQRQQKI